MTTIALTGPSAPPFDAEAQAAAIADDPDLASGFTTWERAADGRRVGRSHLRLAGLW